MRIQHNIAALNSYRNLTNNNSAVSKNLEKLSSGYRINRAGDDAAGLAISEKMRAQITGLETAQKNANDGISLVQTAEGALTEVHSMLNRMVELANQSANGTYDNDVDRANLQKEVDSLLDEINRISEGTNFNGINLLDGTYGSAGSKVERSDAIGIDLSSSLQTGGNAITGANVNQTVLHEAGKAEQKAQFTMDLESLSAKSGGNAGTVDFAFGTDATAVTVAVDVAAGATMTAKDLATALEAAVNQNASGVTGTDGNAIQGIKIGDVVYTAKAEGTKVIFTQADKQDLDNDDDLIPDGHMKFDVTTASKADVSIDGHINSGALNIVPGVAQSSIKYAHAEFTLEKDMLKDGSQLTIGDETYTFRVGKDSFVDKGGKNVIDLSDLEFDDEDFMKEATARLSQAANNNGMFTVGVANNVANGDESATISIDEKPSYTGKADLTTEDGIKAQLSYKTVVNAPRGETQSLTLQIGDTSDDFNKLKLNIDATDAKTLGIADINIGTQEGAAAAVDKIKAAINQVSSVRGDLGAIQNRLEHTINNLSVTAENMTAAESRIRDVDMAKEMMAYTKNNILVQASQAMLAQANQVPQGVLQLLQ